MIYVEDINNFFVDLGLKSIEIHIDRFCNLIEDEGTAEFVLFDSSKGLSLQFNDKKFNMNWWYNVGYSNRSFSMTDVIDYSTSTSFEEDTLITKKISITIQDGINPILITLNIKKEGYIYANSEDVVFQFGYYVRKAKGYCRTTTYYF